MYNFSKNELIEIYQDTISISEIDGSEIKTEKYNFRDVQKHFMSAYRERSGNVMVIPNDTISSALTLEGKTAILNMASPKRPGGGVANGAKAQEECLFRCTDLHKRISTDHYPLKENECLYTRGVKILKDAYYNRIEPIEVDCITIAAINKNKQVPLDKAEYEFLMKEKIRMMLLVPSKEGNCDNIVLGAWGCGVFDNNPNDVARMFKEVLIEGNYSKLYDNVIFGVINDHNSVDNNFKIFSDILNG